ncbi:glyoxylate/hydroxypyruvate reductase HPR3 [Cajanus cajan]|nr:glyoxylate/hydroxypyruvate reductase HPR3 [Cajanus cajan]
MELQPLLVLGLPSIFPAFETLNSHKYIFLKAFSSKLPLLQFLATKNVAPSSIRAILCDPRQALTADILGLLPAVGFVLTTTAGMDHIDLSECRRRGIQVVSIGSLAADDVADMAIGLLIDVLYKISANNRRVRKCVASKPLNFTMAPKLGGKRVGIVGLGSIGGEVGKRLEAFDCKVMYHSRNEKPFVPYHYYSNVVDLATNCDALVVCCPLTKQTRHIINREVMLALGKDGVIVNVGRGPLIDEKELVHCLMEGEIGGAGLDVFENEPSVPNELFALDNVVLSPHAGAHTKESCQVKCDLVAASLEAFFVSNPRISVQNVIDERHFYPTFECLPASSGEPAYA